ncbi:MAG TPA: YicC/YloC family endoribonuclease [Polyangiaceae bacterium]
MHSMTGFGVGEAALGEGRVSLELRALNHRFLDVRVRIPNEIAEHAFFLEQLVRERLARGRFDVGVRLSGPALPVVRFSPERARSVYAALLDLRDALAPGTEVPLTALTSLPELVTAPAEVDGEQLRDALRTAFEGALVRLFEMRQQEGTALAREVRGRANTCRRLLAEIGARAAGLTDVYRARLRERMDRLLQGTAIQLDAGRLEAELLLLVDRSDVTEELARLHSHFEQFEALLETDGPIGRRLDFLLQEIAREGNTIGAKGQDAPIAHLIVEFKAEVERIREQVQNVE